VTDPSLKPLVDKVEAAYLAYDHQATEKQFDLAYQELLKVERAVADVLAAAGPWLAEREKYEKAWAKLGPSHETAARVPETAATRPDLDAVKAAYQKVQDEINKNHNYAAANALVGALEVALQKAESLTEYKAVDAYDRELVARQLPGKHDYVLEQFPKGIDPALDTLLSDVTAKHDLVRDAIDKKKDYAAATAAVADWDLALDAVLVQGPALVGDKTNFDAAWGKFEPLQAKCLKVRPKPKPFSDLWDAIDKAYLAVDKERKANKYADALTLMPALEKACNDLLAEATKLDSTGQADADTAANEVDALAKNGQLAAKPLDYKLDQLKKLRGTSSFDKNDNKKQFEAQREIFRAMTLDPAFVAEDKKARAAVVTKLTGDAAAKARLKDAKANWSSKTDDEKKAVLEEALMAQSEALGFGANVPPIDVVRKPPVGGISNNGQMRPDGKIEINLDPSSSVHDFEKALDLIFHENSHNYQNKLIKQLEDGTLTKGMPQYDQARVFQMNQATEFGSYIRDDNMDDFDDYQKQPIEDHAHTNGPKTAKAVVKALA
jgi:hypothetical protein